MHLSKDFNLSEFTYSRAAIEHGIDNQPGEEALANLLALVENVLQPLRDALGAPLFITSGYRNEEVNRLVGGVADSQHRRGEAADCYHPKGPCYLLGILSERKIPFDQVIVYRRKKFLHVSYRREGRNRGEVVRKC